MATFATSTRLPLAPADLRRLAKEALSEAAHGRYQEALVNGSEAWSGSSLTGKAAQWGGKYRDSRDNLLTRATAILWRKLGNPDRGPLLLLAVYRPDYSPSKSRTDVVICVELGPNGERAPLRLY